MRIELPTVSNYDVDRTPADVARTGQEIVADYPNVTFRVVYAYDGTDQQPIIAYRGPRREVEAMVIKHYGAGVLRYLAP